MPDPLDIREDRSIVPDGPPPRTDLPKSRKERDILLYELRRQREGNDLRAVLASDPGLAFLVRLLNRCGIYAKAEVISECDQGKRAIGMQIVHEICALSDDAYPDFLRTARKLLRSWAAEDDAASGASKKPLQ